MNAAGEPIALRRFVQQVEQKSRDQNRQREFADAERGTDSGFVVWIEKGNNRGQQPHIEAHEKKGVQEWSAAGPHQHKNNDGFEQRSNRPRGANDVCVGVVGVRLGGWIGGVQRHGHLATEHRTGDVVRPFVQEPRSQNSEKSNGCVKRCDAKRVGR